MNVNMYLIVILMSFMPLSKTAISKCFYNMVIAGGVIVVIVFTPAVSSSAKLFNLIS